MLASMNNECFVSCCTVPGVGSFALSASGMLCSLNGASLSLDKWVNMQSKSHCMEANKKQIFVGTESGAVHSFDAATLSHIVSFAPPAEPHGPALAVRIVGEALHVFFADKTRQVICLNSRAVLQQIDAHAGMITGCEAARCAFATLPEGGFVTSGADNTIRFWNPETGQMSGMVKAGPVDSELLKVSTSSASPGMPGIFVKQKKNSNCSSHADFETGRPKGDHGIKCLRFSEDGLHLASGDRDGFVRVFDSSLETVFVTKSHEGDVNALAFSRPVTADEPVLLASAGRDRKLSVFNASAGYSLVKTSEDHSSGVVAVSFYDRSKLLSAGQDKSVVIRSVKDSEVSREAQKSLQHGTLFDLAVDPQQKTFVVGAQDKKLNVYGPGGKMVRSRALAFKNNTGGDSDMLRVCFASDLYLAVAGKRQISLFDYSNGNQVVLKKEMFCFPC